MLFQSNPAGQRSAPVRSWLKPRPDLAFHGMWGFSDCPFSVIQSMMAPFTPFVSSAWAPFIPFWSWKKVSACSHQACINDFDIQGMPCQLVFQSPVRSGFFAFLGTTGPWPVQKILCSHATATATAWNWLHAVAWVVAISCSRLPTRPVLDWVGPSQSKVAFQLCTKIYWLLI